MQLLLGGKAFDALFDSARNRLYHHETRDTYQARNEDEAFARFQADNTADPRAASFPNWVEVVRGQRARGVVMQRGRIVTEPHTVYTQFLLALGRYNVDAGEALAYLPRHRADPAAAASEDFWLVDDDKVAYSVFDDEECWKGAVLTEDPTLVATAIAIRDRVWAAATPYNEYIAAL